MLLDYREFIVKSKGKLFSSKKTFEILEPESGKVVGSAKNTTGIIGSLLGSTAITVRDTSDNSVVFTLKRGGLLMKKDQVLDSSGKVIGRYKSKKFSLSGGYHIYDGAGKHLAEIKGKMFKAEYKFMTPDGKGEMGSVSRSVGGLGGMAKSLLTGGESYSVKIAPDFQDDESAKILMLAATIAVESLFKTKKTAASSSEE